MKFMVIETFKPGKRNEVYSRFHSKGRMLPAGLSYIDSWLTADGLKCFQLMETRDPGLFAIWIDKWCDLTDFEVIEVIDSPTHYDAEHATNLS